VSVTPAEKRRFFDDLAPRWDDLKPGDACAPGVERGLALVGPLEGRTVVDLGCGTGLLEGHLLPRVGDGRIVAVDFSAEMLARARARHASDRITWICRDVLDTAIADASVDTVLCFNAFPHFPDPAATAREAARWLRPGGPLLVWHDVGREQLAAIHGGGPPPIREDLMLPVDRLAEAVAAAGLVIERAEEDAGSSTLLARRTHGE
jgi:demethylmenaquinone methyltransferase/2-methoxy-6-polyprenyl-1,4-benzoquinol methylase